MKPSLRDSWQAAYQSAVDLTVGQLQAANLQERCARSGAVWTEDGSVEIAFLGWVYRVRPPAFDIAVSGSDEEIPIGEKILILHYLETASGSRPSGEWITFAQVPGGQNYLSNFSARSVDRLVRAFNGRETMLVEAARSLGGCEADYGDVSVHIPAFPHLPVVATLWRGDEEFPPSGNILFDTTVADYLPTEDVVVLAQTIVGRLCK